MKSFIFKGFQNKTLEESRRAIEEHPTEPMEDGQRKIFQRKVPSKGKPKCRLSSLYFTLLKGTVLLLPYFNVSMCTKVHQRLLIYTL